jgi:hypothetical protein
MTTPVPPLRAWSRAVRIASMQLRDLLDRQAPAPARLSPTRSHSASIAGHPNILTILDCFEHAGNRYLASEFASTVIRSPASQTDEWPRIP